MDPSNYKIHKKPPIQYGPKKAPQKQPKLALKPITAPIKPPIPKAHPIKPPAATSNPVPIEPVPTKALKTQLQEPNKAPIAIEPTRDLAGTTSKPFSLELEPAESPKRHKKSKAKKAVKLLLFTLLILTIFAAIAAGGYLYYDKIYAAKKSGNSTEVKASSSINNPINGSKISQNPILNADFIVYGLKTGSLFATDKDDYQQDANVPTIKVIAKSTYPNDKREITINQQKVESNFAEDPNGLKKMADSIGANMPLTTDKGTSYIITGNATGLISIGATLISVRSSASLAIVEWQQIFNSLEPVQI